jgi:hypothetical protein
MSRSAQLLSQARGEAVNKQSHLTLHLSGMREPDKCENVRAALAKLARRHHG